MKPRAMLSADHEQVEPRPASGGGAFAPLSVPVFRRIWIASLLSNFGFLIFGVGVAWEMTRLSDSPGMVALVQTAMTLPMMLVAVPGGAIADMYDRRKIALAGLTFAMLSAALLTSLSSLDLVGPYALLALTFLIGSGIALYSPAWQASIGEQVPPDKLPAAISLGAISFNLARSFGPALGGLIVLALGSRATFALNVVLYLPLWFMYYLWKREVPASRLPPERIDRAIVSGLRYARNSLPIRAVMIRALAFGLASATIYALMPLIARDVLMGDAAVYGILLGSLGVGAVAGAMASSRLRARFSNETIIRLATVVTAAALPVVGLSSWLPVTCLAIGIIGFCNMNVMSEFNVSVQLSSPRWVTARALSLYTSALMGGMAGGAWAWGVVATNWNVTSAFVASGVAVAATLLLAFWLPLPRKEQEEDIALVELGNAPHVAMDLTLRSGPVVIEVEYDVDLDQAREFHGVMTRMSRMRQRIGGFNWSISRDISNPAIWVERYECPTWGDYLRMRDRYSQSDRTLQDEAASFNRSPEGTNVRRRLERPYGSVRWKAESHDPKIDPVSLV